MLRHCLVHFLVLILAFLPARPAHAIVFRDPSADFESFKKFTLQRNQQTYTHWVLEKASQSEIDAHPQVIAFSQRALSEGVNKQVLLDWDMLRQNIELNRSDREILVLLAEKVQQSTEVCRYVLLEPELEAILEAPERTKSCADKASALPSSLISSLTEGDILMVDGKAFRRDQLPRKLLPGSYQWRIISDRDQDRAFIGSAQELKDRLSPRQPWIQGTCDEYQLRHPDFSVLAQAEVFFSEGCVKPGIPPEKTFGHWAKEHKGLLWGLGILAAGVAASQLRDKTLVITKP